MAVMEPPVRIEDDPRDVPTEAIYRLSLGQYRAIIKAGILTEDDPVEFLDGWLVQKMTKNPPHILVTRLIRLALEALLLEGWFISTQDPVVVGQGEPEPDIAVIRGKPLDYRFRLPNADEVALIVEVAHATLRRDKILKKEIYAAAGIPVYWVVNLDDSIIEYYTLPSGPSRHPDYGQMEVYDGYSEIPVVVAGSTVGHFAVRELLALDE